MEQGDLRSGTSLWRARGPTPVDCPVLDGDVTCEVVVVGGGITGALVSFLLVREGVDAVLVDRELPGCGSTAASTGLLQYETDTSLIELIQTRGEQHAVHAYRRGLSAIDELEALVVELGRPCSFQRRATLYLAGSDADMAELRREHECRQHFGFDVRCFEREALHEFASIAAPGALHSSGDGQIDPYGFTQALLRAAQEAGLRTYRRVAVESVEESPGRVALLVGPFRISARAVVFATGYASHALLSRGPGTLKTTYASAGRPLPSFSSWPDGCLIWETSRPYFYARQTTDGRALVGGEDTPGTFDHEDEALLAHKATLLGHRFEAMFPGLRFDPEFVWAGTFAETSDGLPYIGLLPGHEQVYFALGYGGNGITFGMIAARLLTDLFLQRPNADAAVFCFER
jgi:glycine/D-amino acid oxidase-like deaminating enzyme